GDLVLDPFCGSGGTALAALMEGCKAIAIDRSPAATFITKNYCTPVDAEKLKEAFEELKRKAKPEIDWLYETRCNRCDGKATTAYTVYSQIFQCTRCLEKVPLFDCEEVEGQTAAGKPKKVNVCPHCYKRGHHEVIRSQSEKFGAVPVLVSYLCESGCRPTRDERRYNDSDPKKREYFEKYDLGKIREIESKEIPHWYPRGYDMTRFSRYQRDALYYYGVKEVANLFTKRNLWALAVIKTHIDPSSFLNFCFSAILLNSSRMYRHRTGGGGGPKGTDFMIPQIGREMAVWTQLVEKVNLASGGSDYSYTEISISTQSACQMDNVPSNTIDYIFTDPPYAGTIQYGELSSVWEAWQGYSFDWHDEEITINLVRSKTETDWATMMFQAMAECYRVLKPGRWLSLCYHDTSEGTWALIQDIMAEVGFLVDKSDSALFIDTGQKSYNQLVADKVTKRDLVINFHKPRPEELGQWGKGEKGKETFQEQAREIIRDFLESHPGATKDRIYDEVVSRMVRTGQMEAHNFEELLRQVADEVREPVKKNLFESEDPNLFGTHEVNRWYLKETQLAIVDEAESAKEDAAAEKIRSLMAKCLQENPAEEGVHYSDLFEHYIYTVQD
ncbi:MAG: hypothetical protein L0Y56_04280, partial [Nitrospira sp.]|nr:hypothetical protein [Nitrospira sp.]